MRLRKSTPPLPLSWGFPIDREKIPADRPRHDLAEMLVGMTPEAMRGVFDWGTDMGREALDGVDGHAEIRKPAPPATRRPTAPT